MFTIREGEDELLEALEIGVSGYLLKAAVLSWLPNALMDVYCGTFAMPRRLTGSVVQRLRTTEPRRRAILGANARLTSREWEVLNLIAGGLSTRQVADKLTLSPTAIRVHIAAVVRKLGVESRTEAIELFMRPNDERRYLAPPGLAPAHEVIRLVDAPRVLRDPAGLAVAAGRVALDGREPLAVRAGDEPAVRAVPVREDVAARGQPGRRGCSAPPTR